MREFGRNYYKHTQTSRRVKGKGAQKKKRETERG